MPNQCMFPYTLLPVQFTVQANCFPLLSVLKDLVCFPGFFAMVCQELYTMVQEEYKQIETRKNKKINLA